MTHRHRGREFVRMLAEGLAFEHVLTEGVAQIGKKDALVRHCTPSASQMHTAIS